MSTNPLYTFTRYYKGPGSEPANNENNNRLIWEYEQRWAENEEERSNDHPRMQNMLLMYCRFLMRIMVPFAS